MMYFAAGDDILLRGKQTGPLEVYFFSSEKWAPYPYRYSQLTGITTLRGSRREVLTDAVAHTGATREAVEAALRG